MIELFNRLFKGKTNLSGGEGHKSRLGVKSMLGEKALSEIEIAQTAAEFVDAFSIEASPIDGSKLDYSEPSLALVDQVIDDFYRLGVPLPDDIHGLASAYVFEVARRRFGGRYLQGDAENPVVLVIGESDAEVGVCVMSKVRGRALNGPEDNIPFFFAGIAPLVSAGRRATLI